MDYKARARQLAQEMKAIADKYNGADVTDDADLSALEQKANELQEVVTKAEAAQAARNRIATATALLERDSDTVVHPTNNDSNPAKKILTLGDTFINDPEYKAWLQRIAPNGHFPEKSKIESPSVSIPWNIKTLLTGASDTSAGAMVATDVSTTPILLGRRPLTFRDIITTGQTNSDTVEYVRITSETNAAAPVAEATATSGSSGTKPESAFALEKVTTNVRTIAHWIPATKRALADAGQLRTLIDNFLRYGLEEELEDQMVLGDGTGENFLGLRNITGTQDQAWDTNLLTTTRRAKTKVRTVGRARPTAYVMHPNDWDDIDLLQDNEARYYYGGPANEGVPRLWGLPVVECEAVPEGEAWVGDFRTLVLWDREQTNITASNSHSDFFTRNLVAILAEMRAAFGALRPSALVQIDLTP
jgi:HK97 family phage major capsid protein